MFFPGNSSHATPLFISGNVLPFSILTTYNSARKNICYLLTSDFLMLETHDLLYIKKLRPSLRLNSFSIFAAMLRN